MITYGCIITKGKNYYLPAHEHTQREHSLLRRINLVGQLSQWPTLRSTHSYLSQRNMLTYFLISPPDS